MYKNPESTPRMRVVQFGDGFSFEVSNAVVTSGFFEKNWKTIVFLCDH